MGTISVSLPSDGDTIDAADYNTPITTIVNEINGNLDNANIDASAAISTSKLADDAGITAAKIADGAVLPNHLLASASTLNTWVWDDWSPTYASITVGTGTVVAKYTKVGKLVCFHWQLVCGNTTSIGNTHTISLPVTAASRYGTSNMQNPIGTTGLFDVGTAIYAGTLVIEGSTTVCTPRWFSATPSALTGTFPITEATNDTYSVQGFYEAA